MKKSIFWAFAFLIIIQAANAIIPTTFQRLSDETLSTNRSAYIFVVGQMNGSATGFIGLDNTSLFYATSLTTAFTNVSVQLSGLGSFTSGILAPVLGNGTCMDVQYTPKMATGPPGVDGYARIGYQAPPAGGNSCGDANTGVACGGSTGTSALNLYTNDVVTDSTAIWSNGLQIDMTLCKNATGAEIYFWNSDTYRTVVSSSPVTKTNFSVRLELSVSKINLTWIAVYNSTTGAPQEISASPPPQITYYNLTNGNGCEAWNTNKNTACNTTSVTPTIQFNTDVNSWCAIARSSTSSLDVNYTDMGSLRNCTGAASGEGSKSHFCTVISSEEIVYEFPNYIYISCKRINNQQNRTSTSGALNISIIGLESAARDSIDLGIRNSLSNNYALYADQKIYARNSANTQSAGTFDRVVKKLSKIWAFNRIGYSDSYVSMFNVTPVFYTLEIINKTSAQITNETELLINATK